MTAQFLVFRRAYELPFVVPVSERDQFHPENLQVETLTLDGAQSSIIKWFQDQADYYRGLGSEEFKADMGLDDETE